MTTDQDRRTVGRLERHLQSLILAIIATAILYGASTITETKQNIAVVNVQLLGLSKKIDATALIREKVSDHEVRIQLLEKTR